MPAVAGTHAPGRGEGVEGLRRWLGDIITAVSCCRGWKGQKTMPSGGNVGDKHTPHGRKISCLTATSNPCQIKIFTTWCLLRTTYLLTKKWLSYL